MKDTDVIVVGGFLALMWYISKHHTMNVAPINTTANAPATATAKPINQPAPEAYGGGEGGADFVGFNERSSDHLTAYNGSGFDEFDILDLIARSQGSTDTYRQQYPVAPSVIDVSDLEQ